LHLFIGKPLERGGRTWRNAKFGRCFFLRTECARIFAGDLREHDERVEVKACLVGDLF
jgi:hypothetical protein